MLKWDTFRGEQGLRIEEIQKIKHAEKFFEGKLEIKFAPQFANKKIVELIKAHIPHIFDQK